MQVHVHHANDAVFRNTMFRPNPEQVLEYYFNDDYMCVANMDINCTEIETALNGAYHYTQHLDHAWQENHEVTTHTEKARSTSVGDLMFVRDDDGKLHLFMVNRIGFKQLL